MNDDHEHLNLLAIFHYVVAGMTALIACIPIIHLLMGIFLLIAPAVAGSSAPRQGQGSLVFLGLLFVIIPGLFIAAGWTLALFVFLAGRRLHRRTAWKFCLVVAAIECIIMPFGTVLGVFTIIVLERASVKAIFGLTPVAPASAAAPGR